MPRPPSLSPELLQTFLRVLAHEGDAVAAAEELDINQPSMSKRLAQLQHAGRILRRPWLERRGKTWVLTEEGQRVLPAVEDIVRRYEQLRQFTVAPAKAGPCVACGQDVVSGVVLVAARAFRRHFPDQPFRVSTPRGQARIEGVASGAFDFALVTHEPPAILQLARRDLHIEELFADPLVLACASSGPVAELFAKLPDTRVSARAVAGLPLVLPEPDSGLREVFDARMHEAGYVPNPVVECGGWSSQLEYVRSGFGVGLLPRSAVAREPELLVKILHSAINPPNVVRLICRRRHDPDGGLDLTAAAAAFRDALMAEVARAFPTEK